MDFEIFKHKRLRNGELTEKFEDNRWTMFFSHNGNCRELSMYSVADLDRFEKRNIYNGHNLTKLMSSGRDILAEEILKNGEPDFDVVKSLLPEINKNAFSFLSGAISWGGVIVRSDRGDIYPQSWGKNRKPSPIFSPVEIDGNLGKIHPKQFLLGGQLPILLSVHSDATNVLELMYFVEPGDPDRDPIVWIRVKKYEKNKPQNYVLSYRMVAISRRISRREMPEDMFWDTLGNTVGYWLNFADRGAKLNIPEKELERVVGGTQISCATTFSGDHAHYGHNIYGEEIHDHFPPNYIWSIEMCCLYGRDAWARRIWEHMTEYLLSDEGRFCYRQGEQELSGASAEEYGALLFLAERYKKQLGADLWSNELWEKIISMGDVILDNCKICPELGNRVLVYMCAEADTNTRVHAYLNNNFWAIRGFDSLAKLLKAYNKNEHATRFEKMSEILLKNTNELVKEESSNIDKIGCVPPFRFGYTAKPATFSICREPLEPMTDAELDNYLNSSHMHDQRNNQDLIENTYANYRYYPEALSAMLLDEHQAKAIVKLRERIGGEFLGMTRFMGQIDDWPVLHYARYLIESEQIEKYILLLYAHTCHHGLPNLMCYYEQVSMNGSVVADDCVPSLLTSPIMTAWMFVYETVAKNRLRLLSGIPLDWFKQGFSAKEIGYSGGKVSISVQNNHIILNFSNPIESEAELVWRPKNELTKTDILSSSEFIERIDGNRIILKKGTTHIEMTIK